MEVGHVCVEAGFGIFVGKEADVGEFVAEDWKIAVSAGQGHGKRNGRRGNTLSEMNMMDFALEWFSGSEM